MTFWDTEVLGISNMCRYCGLTHATACPRIEEIEYFQNGAVKRVKLRQLPEQQPSTVGSVIHPIGCRKGRYHDGECDPPEAFGCVIEHKHGSSEPCRTRDF